MLVRLATCDQDCLPLLKAPSSISHPLLQTICHPATRRARRHDRSIAGLSSARHRSMRVLTSVLPGSQGAYGFTPARRLQGHPWTWRPSIDFSSVLDFTAAVHRLHARPRLHTRPHDHLARQRLDPACNFTDVHPSTSHPRPSTRSSQPSVDFTAVLRLHTFFDFTLVSEFTPVHRFRARP